MQGNGGKSVRSHHEAEDEQKSSLFQQMDGAIKRCLGPGDFVKFGNTTQHHSEGPLLVAAVNEDRLHCWIYYPMMSSILTQFSLPTITTTYIPVSARTVITEVVATSTFEIILRDVVEDLIFILPITEIESGNVFITSATNLFCSLSD
jgi:hypothetical protein